MKLQGSRRLRLLFILSTTILALSVLGFFSLPWMLISSLPTDLAQLPTTDVIIHWVPTLRSESDDWVVQLYQQGKGRKIVCVSLPVSWEVYVADFTRQHLIALGVPADNILTLHLEPEGCVTPNIKQVVAYVKAQGWHSALLVTGPTPPSRQLEKYFQQEGIKLSLTYAAKDRDELVNSWWRTHWKMQVMIEAIKETLLDTAYAECW